MNWTILPATPKDAQILSQITKRSKAFWGYSKEQMEEWDDELNISEDYIIDHYVFKCIIDEEIAAYYALVDAGENKIKLDNLFIHPDFIKQGIGSLLLGEAIIFAQNMKFDVMYLDSDPNAEGFYVHHGFQVIGRKETSIPDRFMPIMALKLA